MKKISHLRLASTLTLTFALIGGLSGCGNWVEVHDAGQLGVGLDAAGRPVISVLSCYPARPVIDLAEGRTATTPDSTPNVHRGTWRSDSAFAGVRAIPVAGPSTNWTPAGNPGKLEADRLFVLSGGTIEDDDASLTPVSFRTADLAGLTPDQVMVAGSVVTRTAFAAYRCH